MAFWKKKKNKSDKPVETDSLQTEAQDKPLETEAEQAPEPVEPELEAKPGARPVEPEGAEPETASGNEPVDPELVEEPGASGVEPQKLEEDAEPDAQTGPGPDSEDVQELTTEQAETEPEGDESSEEKPEPEPQPQKLGFWARRRQRLAAKVEAGESERTQPEPEPAQPSPETQAAEPEPEPDEVQPGVEPSSESEAAEVHPEAEPETDLIGDEDPPAQELEPLTGVSPEPEPEIPADQAEVHLEPQPAEPDSGPADADQIAQAETTEPSREEAPEDAVQPEPEQKLGFWARRKKRKLQAQEVKEAEKAAQHDDDETLQPKAQPDAEISDQTDQVPISEEQIESEQLEGTEEAADPLAPGAIEPEPQSEPQYEDEPEAIEPEPDELEQTPAQAQPDDVETAIQPVSETGSETNEPEAGAAIEAEEPEAAESPEDEVPKGETEAEEAPEEETAAESDSEDGAGAPDEETERKGFISRIFQRLGKTRSKIGGSIERITFGKKIDDEVLDELEEVLITADLGMDTTISLIDGLRGKVRRKELNDATALKDALKEGIQNAMAKAPAPLARENKPHVILMVGVNGVGKTTTIGKLANYFKNQGLNVMLAAGDTFRAAAAEQLGIWAERTGCLFVRQKEGTDPSSVAYSAVESALSKEVDIVLIDTAGRLHTKVNLMEELKKIHRVVGKKYPGAPHEVLLVLDATTGQNALSQAKMFNQAVPLNGVVLTKLDGTAKGGIVVAISSELELPVCFVGLGEGVEDLRPFVPEEFADALF